MNCANCDYPLWTIEDRICPECGHPFLPSDFKFNPRSVRFCCPHCEQHYFGTSADGHLIPRTFDCVTCGMRIDMDEMVLHPAEGLDVDLTRVGTNPWIDRRIKGFFARWFSTIGSAMFSPRKLIEHTPIASSPWRALWFAFFTSFVCALVNGLALGTLFVIGTTFLPPMGGRGPTGAIVGIGGFILYLLAAAMVWLFAWLCITHFILAISGPTAGGFRRTAQCFGYSSAANIIYITPCISPYLAPVVMIWQTVVGSIMLARSQKISGLRATIAMIIPPLLLFVGITALIFGVMVPTITSTVAVGQGPGATTFQGVRAQTLSLMLDSAASVNGAYPAHSLKLLENDQISANEFASSTNPLDADNIIAGSTSLGRLQTMPRKQKAQAIDAIIQQLPANIIAHRVGDVVFTYHGMNATTSDRGLWVFIAEPAPKPPAGAQQPQQPSWMPQMQAVDTYHVGTVGGGMTAIPAASFTNVLNTQNLLRTSLGLAPLPDPSTVAFNTPAVAAPASPPAGTPDSPPPGG